MIAGKSKSLLYNPLWPEFNYYGYTIIVEGVEASHEFKAYVKECPALEPVTGRTEVLVTERIKNALRKHVKGSPSFDRDDKLFSLINKAMQHGSDKTYVTFQDAMLLSHIKDKEFIRLIFARQIRTYSRTPFPRRIPEAQQTVNDEYIHIFGALPLGTGSIKFSDNAFSETPNQFGQTSIPIRSKFCTKDNVWEIYFTESVVKDKIFLPVEIRTSNKKTNKINLEISKISKELFKAKLEDQTYINCYSDIFSQLLHPLRNDDFLKTSSVPDFLRSIAVLSHIIAGTNTFLDSYHNNSETKKAFTPATKLLNNYFYSWLICYEELMSLLDTTNPSDSFLEKIGKTKILYDFVSEIFSEKVQQLTWHDCPWGLNTDSESLKNYKNDFADYEKTFIERKNPPHSRTNYLFRDRTYMKKVNLVWLEKLTKSSGEELCLCSMALIWFATKDTEIFLSKFEELSKKNSTLKHVPSSFATILNTAERTRKTKISILLKHCILPYAKNNYIPFPPYLTFHDMKEYLFD